MTAPSLRALGAVTSGPSATPTFAAPPGAQPADVILCGWFQDDARTSIAAAPAGFAVPLGAPQVNTGVGGSPNHSLRIYWGRFAAVGPGPYIFTVNPGLGSPTPFIEGRSAAIQDAITFGDPFDDAAGNTSGNLDTALAPPVSAAAAGADRYNFYAATNWNGGTWTEPAGYTERWDANNHLCTFDDLGPFGPGITSPQALNSASARQNAWLGILLPIPPVTVPADVQWCAQTPQTGWSAGTSFTDWEADTPVTNWMAIEPVEDC